MFGGFCTEPLNCPHCQQLIRQLADKDKDQKPADRQEEER